MKKGLWKALGMSFIAVGIFNYLYYGKTGELPSLKDNTMYWLLPLAIGLFTGIGISFINQKLGANLSWKKSLASRFFVGFLLQAVLIATTLVIGAEAAKIIFLDAFTLESLQPELIKLAILIFVLLLVNGIFDLSYFSYQEYSQGKINQLKHEREQIELQYELLKTQLSPHYLFNSLNTISSLLDDTPQQAEQFIRRLVQSYQYLIASQDQKLVSVEEELNFVRAYLFLQKVRFGAALSHVITIQPENYSAKIPPLTIQLLVENAIKHNEFSEHDPLEITIGQEEGNYICVTNENRSLTLAPESFQIGLSNIRKRYGFFTDLPVRVAVDKFFSVSVPLLPKA